MDERRFPDIDCEVCEGFEERLKKEDTMYGWNKVYHEYNEHQSEHLVPENEDLA